MPDPAFDRVSTEPSVQYQARDRVRYAPTVAEALEQGRRAVAAIRRWLPRNVASPILEIGCGPGNLLVGLRDAGYVGARGVDMAPELVAHGREVLAVDAARGTWASEMERSTERFAAIIALDVLEHIEPAQVAATLELTRRHLAPGGRLILRMPNSRSPVVRTIFNGDVTHRFLPDLELLEHLLRAAGFAGRIEFAETRPHHPAKRLAFTLLHRLVVKPAFSLLYFHFYQRWPRVLTPNLYCCAYADA